MKKHEAVFEFCCKDHNLENLECSTACMRLELLLKLSTRARLTKQVILRGSLLIFAYNNNNNNGNFIEIIYVYIQ
jgi:hypothetical protein